MGNRLSNFRILVLPILLGLSSLTFGQISSIGKDWGGLTKYINRTNQQDSVFVYFSSTANPKKGNLNAKFSDGSLSTYTWYKYDVSERIYSSRFKLIAGATSSNLSNLDYGGYRVSIKRTSDDSTQVYTCWVMIDEVAITSISVYNGCDFLELIAKTTPSALSIYNNNIFRYWDITRTNHPEINILGNDYFKNLNWHTSESRITIPSNPSLTLTIGEPAPLYESKYTIIITNPFNRTLTSETDLLPAKATKADFVVYLDKDGNWTDGGSTPGGEAPLKLKLESKSINTDSIYWRIINDPKLFKQSHDSIVWRDSALFTERIDAYPTPEKMIPGKYPIEHITVKLSSGCRDTMTIFCDVDTSAIKPDAIPNVFSPNGDGQNEYFKIKEAQTNITSIKSFHVYILNRQGYHVYEYSGNAKEWEGWNGKIDGNKADAPDGIYYYIIEAVGWDNRTFKRGPYKGFLYLLRGR